MKIVALAACLSATAFGGVVFTDDFELAGAWSMAGRGFAVLPGEGEKGTAGLVWEGKEPDGGWQFYRHDFTGKVGHVYRLTVKAQSTEDVVGRAYVRLVSKTADGKRQNFFQNGMPIINNGWKKNHVGWWTEIRTETPPLPDGSTT